MRDIDGKCRVALVQAEPVMFDKLVFAGDDDGE